MSTSRDSKIGLPLSRVSSSANSSIFFSSKSASFQIWRPRSLAESLRHAPFRSSNARRAAATARSTSSLDAAAICVSTSPVAGLMVSNFFALSTHWPSINKRPGAMFTFVAASIYASLPVAGSPAVKRRLRPPALGTKCPVLFRLKHGRPLLHVSRQTFLRVLTLEEQLLIFAFDRQRRLHR